MDEISSKLRPWQKAQLHEVADGMLKIYHTLARMQFIEKADIAEGPHDMSETLATCKQLNIDDSIIYLYSILPYVEGGGDFVHGGAMLDLRDESNIDDARPINADESETLRPWMTALSSIAPHDTALIYDARKHVIGMYCREVFDGAFRMLHNRTPSVSDDEGLNNDNAANIEDLDAPHPWDEMEARPASKVLRDVVRWYEELIELPGDGKFSGTAWSPKITKPLYIKYGWPSTDFDGEAFLVAKARACAEASVGRSDEEDRDEVAKLEEQLREHKEDTKDQRARLYRKIMAKPKNVDEEWDARWEMLSIEESYNIRRREIQAEKEKVENMPVTNFKPTREQLVLETLKGEMQYSQGLLDNAKAQIAEAEDDDEMARANRLRLPRLEKKARILEKAYVTYQKDENVTPLTRPNYFDGAVDLRERLWHAINMRKTLPEAIKTSRQFWETVPTEAERVRREAESLYQSQGRALAKTAEKVAHVRQQLLDQGYTGWPLEHCDLLEAAGSIV